MIYKEKAKRWKCFDEDISCRGYKFKQDGKCEMEFPMSSVIAEMTCNENAWKDY